jgi:SAM-dependent methyltransferase
MVSRTAADVAHLPHVEVRVGDASAPELPEAAYDVVACCLVLFFLPDPLAAVRAWLPSVAPGGRVGVTTFGEQDPRWKVVDGVFTPYLPKAMLDARTSGTRGPFGSDAGVEALLREAGLVDVRTVRREVVTEFADPEHWIRFSWSHGQRAMWEAVPESDHEAVRAEIVARLEPLGRPIRFTQGVRHTLGRRP